MSCELWALESADLSLTDEGLLGGRSNLSIQDVEEALSLHPAVRDCAVMKMPRPAEQASSRSLLCEQNLMGASRSCETGHAAELTPARLWSGSSFCKNSQKTERQGRSVGFE